MPEPDRIELFVARLGPPSQAMRMGGSVGLRPGEHYDSQGRIDGALLEQPTASPGSGSESH